MKYTIGLDYGTNSVRALVVRCSDGKELASHVFDYPSGHEVIVNGDIAIHIAPWSMTGRTPDGQDLAQSGLSVAVMRRQADGSWRMVIDNPHGGRLLTQDQ